MMAPFECTLHVVGDPASRKKPGCGMTSAEVVKGGEAAASPQSPTKLHVIPRRLISCFED